jgi:hypothetical protein
MMVRPSAAAGHCLRSCAGSRRWLVRAHALGRARWPIGRPTRPRALLEQCASPALSCSPLTIASLILFFSRSSGHGLRGLRQPAVGAARGGLRAQRGLCRLCRTRRAGLSCAARKRRLPWSRLLCLDLDPACCAVLPCASRRAPSTARAQSGRRACCCGRWCARVRESAPPHLPPALSLSRAYACLYRPDTCRVPYASRVCRTPKCVPVCRTPHVCVVHLPRVPQRSRWRTACSICTSRASFTVTSSLETCVRGCGRGCVNQCVCECGAARHVGSRAGGQSLA